MISAFRSRKRLLGARAALFALTAGTLVGLAAPGSASSVGFSTPSPSVVSPAADYATKTYANPWTFSTEPSFPRNTGYGTSESLSNGYLSFTTASAGAFINLVPYWPGSDATQSDGRKHPITASVYNHLVFRMYSSAQKYGQITWARCDWSRDRGCLGAMGFAVYAGWHVYDLAIRPYGDPNATQPWTGVVTMLRLNAISQAGVSIKFDYIRLSAATSAVVPISYSGSSTFRLNGPSGDALPVDSNHRVLIPVGQLPSGYYRAYSVAGGNYSPTVTVRRFPAPVIDSPGEAGMGDWSSSYRRGDLWDMSQSGDYKLENASTVSLSGGVLTARNARPTYNNAIANLPLPAWIDANKWHRLSFRLSYDGAFDINGGTVARFVWQVASAPGKQQQSHDFVIYPGAQAVVVDLARSPAYTVTDETQNTQRIGWSGQKVYSARLDPNEDNWARTWHLDYVRLGYDPVASRSTSVTFHDNAYASGATANIYLSTSPSGSTTWYPVKSGLAVHSGSNTVTVSAPSSLYSHPGKYYVVTRIYDSSKMAYTTAYSQVPVNFSMK